MKKRIVILLTMILMCMNFLFAQTNVGVDINDDVYNVLRSAELANLCKPLSTVKPYTQKYIIDRLNEIKTNLEDQEKDEQVEIIQTYIDRFTTEDGLHIREGYLKLSNLSLDYPSTFIFSNSIHQNFGTGLYKDSDQNSTGYEIYDQLNFMGDIGKYISYRTNAFVGLTKMPLELMGSDYDIGGWLYNNPTPGTRRVSSYRNNSYLPYDYSKFWDGSVYYLTNFNCAGLEGWPFDTALAFGMTGDLHASFYDNNIEIGISRVKREWGAMDDGSSLIMNSHARPFLAAEMRVSPVKNISLSALTGVLEFPNQDYINKNAWYKIDENGANIGTIEDYYFFQNAFSILMMDIDFTKLHIDFGSTCVWPKRFEIGYAFPLIDNVVYQNDVGDNDNLALFGNIKYTIPGKASFWFSGYLDEINSFTTKFWVKTRAMFAFQAGTKVNIPFIPFTTASLRYTKVEPYCYTHHGINYTPWYDHYISENYTNNGECIGYYLAPNSDEINFQIESTPSAYTGVGLQYQLIRHGVDWGSGAVMGSNLYSELPNVDRSSLNKYFLHDGTYEWSNVVSLHGTFNLKKYDIPMKVYGSLGFIYDWFTEINAEPGKNTPYSTVNNETYPEKLGFVGNIGVSLFFE